MWYDMYLTNRDALPLNLNPQLTWRDDPVSSKNEQAVKAANLAHAAVRFHLTLEAQKLLPDIYHTKPEVSKNPLFHWAIGTFVPRKFAYYPMYLAGGYALDMSQYPRLFKSTRCVLSILHACPHYAASGKLSYARTHARTQEGPHQLQAFHPRGVSRT